MTSRNAGRAALYLWAAPTTFVGLAAGAFTMASGGRFQTRQGVLEFHGGFARWLLCRVNAAAMTLGHVVIGRDLACLDSCRDHELAHVRQVEWFGPLFIPAYFAASLWAWMRGRHYYLDNWFERDARIRCGDEWPDCPW